MQRKKLVLLTAALLSAAMLWGCGSSGSGDNLVPSRDGQLTEVGSASCLQCHNVQTHVDGSAFWSSANPLVGNAAKALFIHHDCEACHGLGSAHHGTFGTIPHPRPNSAVCAGCHEQVEAVIAANDHMGGLDNFGNPIPACAACHDVLGLSRFEWVAERRVLGCTECHNQALAGAALAAAPYASEIYDRFATSRHANQAARAAACSACHSHEGGIALLAMGRMTSDADLKAAYTADTVEAYLLPVGSSTIAGVNRKTCATCHDPHATDQRGLRGDGDVLASADTVAGFPVAAGTAVDGEVRVAYSAEFNLCTACHIVDLAATWDATAGYSGRGMITYELSDAYTAANLVSATTNTFDFSKAPFYHDGGSGNGRTLIDTHFAGTVAEHLVKFNGVDADFAVKGYNINAGSANACTICHDPHTGGKMLSVIAGQADNISNKAIGYAEGLGDFHTGYTKDAFSRNQTGCTPCHTGNDFVKVTLGATTAAERWNVVGCRSCHNLAVANATAGTNNSAAFAAVRQFPAAHKFAFPAWNTATPSVVVQNGGTAIPVSEIGAQNVVCFECHKGRTPGKLPATDPVAGTTNYAISYLHYAPAMAILFGDDAKMVLTYPEKTYAGRFQHYDGAKLGCVDCHDVHNTQGNHVAANKMTASGSTCVVCHADTSATLSPAVLQDRTQAFSERLLEAIYDKMEEAHALKVSDNARYLQFNASLRTVLEDIFETKAGNRDAQDVALIKHIAGRQTWFPSVQVAHAVATWKVFTYEDGAVHGTAYGEDYSVHGHGGSWAHNSAFARQVMFDAIEDLGGDLTGLTRP